jgi:tRNA (guanine37-N1)-methyltransferase
MSANFEILTIFPELFEPFKNSGLISRAISENKVKIDVTQLRDFAINTHGQIDDTPYGGGSGMVLRIEPAVAAIKRAKEKLPNAKVVLFSPRGKVFNQEMLRKFEIEKNADEHNADFIILCNRYEGVDERIIQHYVDLELSLGDYILMGSEVPAMAFMESVCRLLPGVLGNPESTKHESFENYLLEYPQYTKPSVYEELSVPSVLLSGNHKEIQKWQQEQALKITQERRPDLYQKAIHSKQLEPKITNPNISLALIHYPVLGKKNEIITSSITNIDLHDIARSCKTFDINTLYIVHPTKILRRLSEKILEHWDTGFGSTYNPNRKEALALLKILPTIEDAILDLQTRTGKAPTIVTTSARSGSDTTSYEDFREIIANTNNPFLILFGTGWGLADEIMELAKYRLDPILGRGRYNHLSVRSAAAIILDRLLG